MPSQVRLRAGRRVLVSGDKGQRACRQAVIPVVAVVPVDSFETWVRGGTGLVHKAEADAPADDGSDVSNPSLNPAESQLERSRRYHRTGAPRDSLMRGAGARI